EKARIEALRLATINARKKAETMAGALGMKVVRLVSVEDQSPSAWGGLHIGRSGYTSAGTGSTGPGLSSQSLQPASAGIYSSQDINFTFVVTVVVEAAP